MKKFTFIAVLALVVVLSSGSAFAANSLQQGKMGIGVGMGNSVFGVRALPNTGVFLNDVVDITGRYLINRDMALLVQFGLQSDGADADSMYLSIGAGVRKYLKVDDFAPFFEGMLSYTSIKVNPDILDQSITEVSGKFGGEYFLAKQFSVEGSIGAAIGQVSDSKPASKKDSYFGTRTWGVRANFYF